VFVLTLDQENSRLEPDRVPALLGKLRGIRDMDVRFDRTQGDEVQGLTESPQAVLDAATLALREGGWHIGIGFGAVETPLPRRPAAARGEALLLARGAVERAKRTRGRTPMVAVGGTDDRTAARIQAALRLVAELREGRTAAGWEACDLMSLPGMTGARAAERLGISPQSMSDRLRAARWFVDVEAQALALELLAEARLS
jgi:hypothetical protein